AGQRALLDARVLIVGAGGLGSPAALYLAAAGVGTIGIVDGDVVDESNLHRQVLHASDRVGDRKVDSAERTLRALNPDTRVVTHDERLDAASADRLLAGYDVIVDGTDSLEARYVINDAAVRLGATVVHGSVHRWDGQVTAFAPAGPCYRCLHPVPPPADLAPDCTVAGVVGVVPGIVGMLQATEALKVLLGVGEPLIGRILVVDALGATFDEIRVDQHPECPACGRGQR
ncbi:MAG: ThiF family adenylyltransferase, partial [Chloroflexi bacterium]|nr:ThiF family adenylyltransferase [Chloroflexota bacterium]